MISERHLPNLCRAHPHASLVHSPPRRYLRLKEMLKQKLVDSGWREDLKSYTMGAPPLHCPHRTLSTETLYGRCADLIRTKGDEQLTVEQLTQEITPRGRGAATSLYPARSLANECCLLCAATVPDEVKAELLLRIRRFVEEQAV